MALYLAFAVPIATGAQALAVTVPIATGAQALAVTVVRPAAQPTAPSAGQAHPVGGPHAPRRQPAAAAKRQAPHARPPAAPVHAAVAYPDDLQGWIAQASAILAGHGDSVPPASAIEARAMTESSGNPLAENHWDANQALYGGTYGLMQLIPPTFGEWSLPGHRNILNPVDSIIASVRYANDRYGSFTVIAYGKQGY